MKRQKNILPLLICISLLLKGTAVWLIVKDPWYDRMAEEIEKLNYLFDAFLFLVLYWKWEAKIRALLFKITAAVCNVTAQMAVLMGFNYSLLYLEESLKWRYRGYDLTFLDVVKDSLWRYLTCGYPKYHEVVFYSLGFCFAVILFRKLLPFFARKLVSILQEGKGGIFSLSACNLLLEELGLYLSLSEYDFVYNKREELLAERFAKQMEEWLEDYEEEESKIDWPQFKK